MAETGDRQAELRGILDARRQEAAEEIRQVVLRHRTADVHADTARPSEWGDQVSQHIDDDLDAVIVQRKAEQLRRIDRAVLRLESGRYGNCEGCGDPIGIERLRLVPFATYCIPCQEASE